MKKRSQPIHGALWRRRQWPRPSSACVLVCRTCLQQKHVWWRWSHQFTYLVSCMHSWSSVICVLVVQMQHPPGIVYHCSSSSNCLVIVFQPNSMSILWPKLLCSCLTHGNDLLPHALMLMQCTRAYVCTHMYMHMQVTFMAISRTSFALRRCCGEWVPCSHQPHFSSWEIMLTGEHMVLRYAHVYVVQ